MSNTPWYLKTRGVRFTTVFGLLCVGVDLPWLLWRRYEGKPVEPFDMFITGVVIYICVATIGDVLEEKKP